MGKSVEAKDLNIYYRTAGKIFTSKKDRMVYVKDLSFDIYKGEIFGLVGESGCGKTTVAKALTGLNTDIEGTMDLGGTMPQMVFQDPFSSLNPAMKIGKILEEPLKHRQGRAQEKGERDAPGHRLGRELCQEVCQRAFRRSEAEDSHRPCSHEGREVHHS